MLLLSGIYLIIGGLLLDALVRIMKHKSMKYSRTVWIMGGIAVVFLWPLIILDAVIRKMKGEENARS